LNVHTLAFERGMGVGGQIGREARQYARAGLDQNHSGLARVDVAEVRRQIVEREFGDGARELDAGRASADDDEGEQGGAPRRIGFPFGPLERHEDSAANRGGVLQGLESGCVRLPFVVAEVGVARAGRQHQGVVADLRAIV